MGYIKISPSTSIKELKKTFSSYYPNLKIEFYKNWHDAGEGSPPSEQVDDAKILQDLNPTFKQDILNLTEDLTVRNIESAFEELDLHIQVFRKRNGVWLQTTTSDDKTLSTLNSDGNKA